MVIMVVSFVMCDLQGMTAGHKLGCECPLSRGKIVGKSSRFILVLKLPATRLAQPGQAELGAGIGNLEQMRLHVTVL